MFPTLFPLHESTQRCICRAAFAVLCVIPTTLLLGYAWWVNTPIYRRAQAADISQKTGVRVTIADLRYPRPGLARLTNITLAHADTGETLANIRELELSRAGDGLLVVASQPQFDGERMHILWRQIEQHLLNESFPAYDALRLVAHDATLTTSAGESQTFAVLEANFARHSAGRSLQVTYQLAGSDSSVPAEFSLLHDAVGDSRIHWSTGEEDLPVAPWAEQFRWLKALGSDCHFRGIVAISRNEQGLNGSMQGELTNVDLDRLITDQLPHKLSGTATIELHNVRIEDSRLREFDIRVQAGPGVISQTLIDQAEKQWRLETDSSRTNESAKSLQAYDQIACDVQVVDGRLSLAGTTLLLLPDGTSYRTPSNATYDPASILRVLSTSQGATVPVTESTRQLIHWLPLSQEPAGAGDAQTPTAHLRGGLSP